jgi:hypothetical protein
LEHEKAGRTPLGWSRVLAGPDGWFVIGFAIAATLGLVYLASVLTLGLNGTHIWRQSDSLSHILSLTPDADKAPLTDFLGRQRMYDVPIYQGTVAFFSDLFAVAPLSMARILNMFAFVGILVFLGRLAERLCPGAGLFAWFLAATSPPLLHYLSTPIPDPAVIFLCLLAVTCLGSHPRWSASLAASAFLFLVAAVMKSPVPYVFLAYALTYALLTEPRALRENAVAVVFVLAAALAGAVASEAIRIQFNLPRTDWGSPRYDWYFGTLAQRFDGTTWLIAIARLVAGLANNLLFAVGFLATALAIWKGNARVRASAIATTVACLAGWATFTNVYKIHDYYTLPLVVLVILAFSGAIAGVLTAPRAEPGQIYRPRVVIAMIAVFGISAAGMQKQSVFASDDVYAAMRHTLDGAERIAWISLDGHEARGPSPGGRLGKAFSRFETDIALTDCLAMSDRFDAIVVRGAPACGGVWQDTARSVVRGSTYSVFVWSPVRAGQWQSADGQWDRVFLMQRLPGFQDALRDTD